MKVVEANLPSLGLCNIRFCNESEAVYDFLGTSEFSRLDDINHLGISSYVFTGSNHSRLEYVLLQCAIIELLPKFHKGKEGLSLGGKVSIPGQKRKISSGEELLKCWAVLSNSGHTQYTYGVERSLLNKACEDDSFRKILVDGFPSDLKRESLRIISNYEDSSFHLILALYKINRLPKGSRLKAELFRMMKVLILPADIQKIEKPHERYKIQRLKTLYNRVRLLSIVSLDSYYSHHPIRYDISSALMSLDSLFSPPGEQSSFLGLLRETATWLADELYLHPKAASAQKNYEVDSKSKIEGQYAKRFKTKDEFDKFFLNIMSNGFGKPKPETLTPLARMSFPYVRQGTWFGRSLYELNSILEKQISPSNTDHVSVLLNPYSKSLHVDLLYDPYKSDDLSIGLLCSRTVSWLLRLIEAQIKHRMRRFSSSLKGDVEFEARIRERDTPRFVRTASPSIKSLFSGVISFLLPEGVSGNFTEVITARRDGPVGFKLNLVDGAIFDTLVPEIDEIISSNQANLDVDRLHEISALRRYVSRSKAKVVVASLEKFVIKDRNGQDIDDWDGVVLEVFDEGAVFSIIEAKNLKNKSSRVSQSFNQLKATQSMIKKKHKTISSRRNRMAGYGAVLRFQLKV